MRLEQLKELEGLKFTKESLDIHIDRTYKGSETDYTYYIFEYYGVAVLTKEVGDDYYLVLSVNDDMIRWSSYQYDAFFTMLGESLSIEESIQKTTNDEFRIYWGNTEDVAEEILQELVENEEIPLWITDYVNLHDIFDKYDVEYDLVELWNEEGYINIYW